MNTKKFPTPNLDAWNDGIEGSFRDVNEAVQSDIALAVKGAANVPDGVRETLLEIANEEMAFHVTSQYPREKIAAAQAWLESLTVAPESAPLLVPMQFIETRTKAGENTFAVDSIEPVMPVEKRCGTCAWFVLRTDWSENYGQCNRSVIPSTTTNRCGDMCLCWKAKP